MFLTNTFRTSGSAPGTSPSDFDWNTTRLPSALMACGPALESATGVAKQAEQVRRARDDRGGVRGQWRCRGRGGECAAAAASAATRSLLELNICGGSPFLLVQKSARASADARTGRDTPWRTSSRRKPRRRSSQLTAALVAALTSASLGRAASLSREAMFTALPYQSPSSSTRGAGVHAHAHGQQVAARADLVQHLLGQGHRGVGVRRPDHHAVAHRLDVAGAVAAAERGHRALELARHPCGVLVALDLREHGVAHEVGEQEGRRAARGSPSGGGAVGGRRRRPTPGPRRRWNR